MATIQKQVSSSVEERNERKRKLHAKHIPATLQSTTFRAYVRS